MENTTSMFYSGIVGAVAGTIVTGVVSLVTSGYEMHEAIDETLYSLHQEVLKIQSAIEEARGRQITNENLLVWLEELVDAAYRGKYYLRTFKSRSSHLRTKGTSNVLIDHTSPPAKRRRITPEVVKTLKGHFSVVKTLKGHLECRELHDVLKMLKFIDVSLFLQMVYAQPERPMKRYLYMDHTWLIDRGMQREQVMKFLFEPSMAGENNVDVLQIVGDRGVGKTTLALHCFYDPKVQNHFSLKIYMDKPYITYSPPFFPCPTGIFEYILSQCNNTQITNYGDENTLLAMLKQNLFSEKFLIVIDDVWSIDSKVWNVLLGCLRCGKEGSKIIFTRRLCFHNNSKFFGKIPETVRPIMLDGFCEEQYMLFFREHAFGSADPEDHPELTKIGGEIAKKMNGSMWGARIIGELLRDNFNAPFWSTFLRDGVLNSSLFLHHKGNFPLRATISRLLPKGLQIVDINSWTNRDCGELPSLRELMVLGPKCCTPVIKNKYDMGVDFLVTKHFNLHQRVFVTVSVKPC